MAVDRAQMIILDYQTILSEENNKEKQENVEGWQSDEKVILDEIVFLLIVLSSIGDYVAADQSRAGFPIR